jgi:hypothetical protein
VITDLSADLVTQGDVTISGTVQAGGPGTVRLIDAENITVSGTLRVAPGMQGITLRASGDLFISGTIDAGGSGNTGAGTITLAAGGTLFLATSGRILVSGHLGGVGGNLQMVKAATATLLGTLDARGGDGSLGGAGGTIAITADVIAVGWNAVAADGGEGGRAGGAGGTLDVASFGGGVSISGTWEAVGGPSADTSGKGGKIVLTADTAGGDLTSDAVLLALGGSPTAGSTSAAGGEGGTIRLVANSDPTNPIPAGTEGGSILLTSRSVLSADGGDSTGPAPAGAGGLLNFQIPQMHVTLDGYLSARGGEARGSGVGGYGGMVWVASDLNGNATGGEVTLLSTGVVDASGGDSGSGLGGDARWSSTNPWIISDTNPKAVLFDSDNVNGGGIGGAILNQGLVRAHGGKHGGHGGDVEFHGLGTWDNQGTGELNPLPGNVDNKGDASGDGVFISD